MGLNALLALPSPRFCASIRILVRLSILSSNALVGCPWLKMEIRNTPLAFLMLLPSYILTKFSNGFIQLNIYLAIATLSRRLSIQCGLTREHIQKVAIERNEKLRTLWEANMAEYMDPDVFAAMRGAVECILATILGRWCHITLEN